MGADPDTGECRGLNNGLQLGLGDKVGLSLLESFSRGVGLRVGLGVDVGLCLGLSSSESMLLDLCLVDDLGRHPNTSSRLEHNGSVDLSLSELLGGGDALDLCLVHGNSGGDGHGLSHGLCHGLEMKRISVRRHKQQM